MKILLINPPRVYRQGTKGIRLGLPLGILSIAGYLEKYDFKPSVFDCLIHEKACLESNDGQIRHGVPESKIREEVQKYEPEIVGVSSPFSAQINQAVRIVQIVKELYPQAITVIGGPHASVRGYELLEKNKCIDAVVQGEGELPFLEFVRAVSKSLSYDNVPRILYRLHTNGHIKESRRAGFIENVDTIPYPAYHQIDMNLYFSLLKKGYRTRAYHGQNAISMITSRGCPFECIFCSIHAHMGRPWRAHSPEYVIGHIEHVVKQYGVQHISFEDDNFTLDKMRTERILQAMKERHVSITWDTPNGIRCDTLSDHILVLMRETGCSELSIGVESGVQRVLDKVVNKRITLSEVIRAARMCKAHGMKMKAFYVLGMPGESLYEIYRTVFFGLWLYAKYEVLPNINIATPLYGTRMYDLCKECNWFVCEPTEERLAVATQVNGKSLIRTNAFTPRDVYVCARLFQWGIFCIHQMLKMKRLIFCRR